MNIERNFRDFNEKCQTVERKGEINKDDAENGYDESTKF